MRPIIDTREKEQYRYVFAEEFGQPLVQKLHSGDYSLEGLEEIFAIERKRTVAEIAQNITEKRFADWTSRLGALEFPYILCEFSYSDIYNFPRFENLQSYIKRKIRVTGPYVTSKLLQLNVDFPRINIIFAGNKAYANYLAECIMLKIKNECERRNS
jgi:hypothetical protein